MYHPFVPHLRTVRLTVAACSLLTVSVLTLSLPPRGAAQSDMSQPYAPNAATDTSSSDTAQDSAGSSNANSDSTTGTENNAGSDPAVGVDNTGHSDAVATRNGRTARRSLPAPANPLVITDPTRSPNTANPSESGSGGGSSRFNRTIGRNAAGDYPTSPDDPYTPNNSDNTTSSPLSAALTPDANRLIPPVQTRQPGDYTLLTDPAAQAQRRRQTPLPLFGYDFFQPARQIIVARRRALLPSVRRTNSYNNNYNNSRTPNTANGSRNSRLQSQTTTNSSNGTNSNYPEGSYPGNNPADNSADLTGAALAGTRRGVSPPDQNSGYPDGRYPSQDGTDPNAPENPSQNDNTGDSSGYPASRSNRVMQNGDPQNNTEGYDTQNNSDTGYGSDPSTTDTDSLMGSDSSENGDPSTERPSRRRSPNSDPLYTNLPYDPNTDPNGSNFSGLGDSFPGDATTPLGSDIQFPGDDALVQNGTANAVTGQIADPVSTLYKNVLASLPPNYQLQPGDVLTVRYSALTLAPREFTTTVDVEGGIDVSGVGRISVTGRTSSQAETALRQRLERLYRSVDVSINLRQLRTIQVTVSGAAFAPGTYTVPATATAFNVLNAAGGPTANGSLREIRVLRGGRLAGVLDIYPLIGAVSARSDARASDIALQSGDNIYVPARLSRISLRGEVRQPAVYELTTAETLRDALSYAGGVKPSGVDQNVHIDTVDNGVGRVIVDVNLRNKPQVAATPLFDGDSVQVSSVRAILTNRVTIAGAVDQPGDYALTPAMRVSDLISRARGPLYNAYLDRADLTRLNADNTTTLQSLNIAKALDGDPTQNITLKRFDRVRLYSRQEVAYLGRRLVTVRGAVQRPGLYTQSDNMKVSDLLLDSGGPLPDAYLNRAVLLHQRGDGTYAYDYISLRDALNGDTSQDLLVQDNDVLAVYKVGEAHFTPDHTVKVLGNVVAPGLYARGEGMHLSDLLKLSGAFKPGGGTRVTLAHARRPASDPIVQIAPTTVEYTAEAVPAEGTDVVLQDGDVVAVQGDGSIKDHPAVVTVTGQVNRPGPILIKAGMRLSDAVKEAGGLRPEAFAPGAEFTRMSDSLITPGQLDLAEVINQMSNLLNLSQYQRERAKANLALIEAAGSAASGSSNSGLAIPGLGGNSSSNNAANPNLAPLIATLPQNNPVSPGRLLTPSQLQPNGGVAVRLADALRRPGSSEDVLLKDGDTLVIPETPTTVQVIGAVFNPRGVLYRPGQSIDYYIQSVGGYTPDAARDRIEVIHAGGGLIPADKAGVLQPGDLILVPTKVLAEKVSQSGNGFSNFFQALVGSAITLKVLSSVFGL